MLQYHYEHENCHSLTEQLVDSHIKLLQVEFQSLRKNTTVDVIITEPDGIEQICASHHNFAIQIGVFGEI